MEDRQPRLSAIERLFRWMEKIVRIVVGGILKWFKTELTEKQWIAFLQFFRFAVIGVFNTAIFLFFNTLTLILAEKAGWDGVIGTVGGFDRHLGTMVGFLANCVNSYLFNSRFTFGTGEKKTFGQHARAFLKVMIAYSFAGLFLGWALNVLWLHIGLNKYLGMVLNVIISVPINFLLNKYWAYREK